MYWKISPLLRWAAAVVVSPVFPQAAAWGCSMVDNGCKSNGFGTSAENAWNYSMRIAKYGAYDGFDICMGGVSGDLSTPSVTEIGIAVAETQVSHFHRDEEPKGSSSTNNRRSSSKNTGGGATNNSFTGGGGATNSSFTGGGATNNRPRGGGLPGGSWILSARKVGLSNPSVSGQQTLKCELRTPDGALVPPLYPLQTRGQISESEWTTGPRVIIIILHWRRCHQQQTKRRRPPWGKLDTTSQERWTFKTICFWSTNTEM
eukprot:TRINITY_DN55383_c0_g1_i1.p1 TRINITY_DN55383_c0_g1~~TRINITY_DN55383_c0_g1_i1.p1  ORF type:complete len:260 (-),score=33.60 TRINITY_DN55383_c0_g1_i1:282-1061(-)